jgi:hypothetical protein
MNYNFNILRFLSLTLCLLWSIVGSGQIISQYVETDSGTTPKGIEIWNNTGSDIVFSPTNNLQIFQGTNGGSCTEETDTTSGTLNDGEVWVIGSSDIITYVNSNGSDLSGTTTFGFAFNGDDALEVRLGGNLIDMFGMCGSDPGSSWSGSGVSTGNQNIELLANISTGNTSGFTDPSTRFSTVSTSPSSSGGLVGFGDAPAAAGPTILLSENSINGLNYIEGNGPSSPQSFEVSGSNLDGTDVILNTSTNFEISNSQAGTYNNSLTLSNFNGSTTEIWVRLKSGLTFGNYSEDITVSGGGASTEVVSLTGNVTGQIIVQQDFDSSLPEWNYTNDVSFFDDGWGTSYYGLIDISLANPLNNSNFNGNILGENDLQSTNGTNGVATLSFENINISGYTNVELSFDYQFVGYNANDDEGSYEVFEDDTGQGQVFLADGSITALENTNGSESVSISTGINEVSLNYLLENNGATGYSGIDNIQLTGLANDTDTQINPPATQVLGDDIVVDEAISISTSVPVFKFDIQDIGGDGLVTELTHVRVIPGPNNSANWSNVIEGVRLEGDGNNVSEDDQNLTILDDELIIEVTTNNGEMTIANNDSKEYTISVFLDPDFAVEGEIIQMAIDDSNDHFFVNSSGSMMSLNISGFEGEEHTIQIEGNKLEFIVNPTTTIINENMGAVQVAYTDDEGKVDTDFNAQVSISSTGTLSGGSISVNAVNGVASFSTLVHTALGNNLTLTASSSGESDIVSSSFSIVSLPELLISEISDPPNPNSSDKYVEIYNAGITPIDFSLNSYFLTREANAGSQYETIKLVGVLQPKEYYIVANDGTDFSAVYNGATFDIEGSSLGNGNDSYFLSTDGIETTNGSNAIDAINSLFDIYGEIGVDGEDPVVTNWNYEDSRAYRLNPDVKNANEIWTSTEWFVDTDGANVADMTPGYGDNDYIYDGSGWSTNIYLNSSPDNNIPEPDKNIFITSGTFSLTQDKTIGDLVVRSGATLNLEPGVKLTVNGDIVNEGTIVFKSNDTSTAVLEAVSDNTRVVGDGFEIHRRIPVQDEFRAFRYLSSSVDTQNSLFPNVYDNWQEGGATPSGFGTHITGSTTGSNGFDATETGNPSMFFYDPALTQPWQSIPNTNNTNFGVGDAYAILIRGDRNAPLDTNDQTGASTTLRTTGKIHVGDFEVSNLSGTIGHFNLVGNPYQSQVDLEKLLPDGTNVQDLETNQVYVWDPTIGSLGGYATIDFSMASVSIESIPFGETTPVTSNANKYLQPQQAFFVETTDTNPSLTFTEDDKNNNSEQTAVFSTEEESISALLDISLKDENNKTYDGLRIVYDNTFSNAIDNQDAVKFWNYTDHLALLNDSNYLSIEKRSIPTTGEVTPLYFGSQSLDSYSLEFQFYAEDGLNVYLIDHYTDQSIAIPNQTTFTYDFSVDSNIPESISNTRFSIAYENTGLNTQNFEEFNFTVYPNPAEVGDMLYVKPKSRLSANIKSIELLNLNGQIIKVLPSTSLEVSNGLIKIPFNESLSNGVFFLKINTGQSVSIHKIIFK